MSLNLQWKLLSFAMCNKNNYFGYILEHSLFQLYHYLFNLNILTISIFLNYKVY